MAHPALRILDVFQIKCRPRFNANRTGRKRFERKHGVPKFRRQAEHVNADANLRLVVTLSFLRSGKGHSDPPQASRSSLSLERLKL